MRNQTIDVYLLTPLECRLSQNQSIAQGYAILFEKLRHGDCIRSLSFCFNYRFNDEAIEALCEFIKVNNTLECLNIGSTGITYKGLKSLAFCLQGNKSMRMLDIIGVNAGDKTSSDLVEMIEKSNIEIVYADDYRIDQLNHLVCPLITNCLKNKSHRIDCRKMNIRNDDIPKICDIFEMYDLNYVHEIDFGGNEISTKGAITLFGVLKTCKSLEVFHFGWNPIDDKCIDNFVQFMMSCPNIRSIELSGKWSSVIKSFGRERESLGRLTNVAIAKLATWLTGNKIVRDIDISFNERITKKSMSILSKMIENSNLETITLDCASIPFQYNLLIPLIANKLRNGSMIDMIVSQMLVDCHY